MKKGYNKCEGYNLLALKALGLFLKNPHKEFYLREFARESGISLNSSQRFLGLFLREGLIKEERKANLRYFKADTENLVFREIKRTFSIRELVKSGLVDYLREQGCSNAVLFGSVAKGLDDAKSDIDILVIKTGGKIRGIERFYLKLRREPNIHIFSLSEWKKQARENKAFYQDVISTGINLIGEMPLV